MHILLADDQPEVRSALRLLLENESWMGEVDEAVDAQDLLNQVKATFPDLVLLDWELPGLQSEHKSCLISCSSITIAGLRSISPRSKVIVLSGRLEARTEALNAQADFFVSKGDPPDVLLATLRKIVVNGQS